jgi:2,4'-dihydroxyacetophenone dioxygenase
MLLLIATESVDGFSLPPPRVLEASASGTRHPPNRNGDPTAATTYRPYFSASTDVSLGVEAEAAEAQGDYAPFQGRQPQEALSEIFIPQVMSHNHILSTGGGGGSRRSSSQEGGVADAADDELLWVPQTETVSFRPLCLCLSGGYYVNLLRVRGSGLLSRHRHPGPVHGHVLRGRWRYLEHDWEAVAGSYVFEPPGETHTLVVPDGVDEMITLFHVTGSLLYCDPDGTVVGAEDVFTKLELAKKHYADVGLGEDFVKQFVR